MSLQRKRDPQFAIRAMQLSSAQQQALATMRGRYAGALRAHVTRRNPLTRQHTAIESVVTPEQRRPFQQAIQAPRHCARRPAERVGAQLAYHGPTPARPLCRRQCGSDSGVDSHTHSRYTHGMSKRLQVVLDDEEYRDIERIARRQRTTVSGWVRQSLRQARQSEPAVDAGRKLKVVRAAAGHQFPAADIDRMLGEIERGYLGE